MNYPAPRPVLVIAIFAALAVGSSLVEIALSSVNGAQASVGRSTAHNSFVWLLFGALSFIAIFAARHFPLERDRLARHLPVHAGAFIAISATHTVLYTAFAKYVLWPGREEQVAQSWRAVLSNLRGDVFLYAMMVGAYYLYALSVRRREPISLPKPEKRVEIVEAPALLKRIPVKDDGVVAFIDTADVESIEADGDYVKLNGPFGSRSLRQSLSALEKQLDPDEFARIHRSTIVSLSRIKELQPWFHGEFVAVMASGARLKVSRTHRATLTEALKL